VQENAGVQTALAPASAAAPGLGSDPHDFAGLYIRHRASFTSHARRYLRDGRDADEVVQEAFLRLFLAMPELDNELQALAYCRRTITNLCIDRYRADARRPRLVALDGAPIDELAEDDAGDPVVRAEDAALVRAALSQLPELHRAALVKREIEEKSLPVIADELDVAEDNVKHLLFRARRTLRKLLAGTSVAPGADAERARGLRPAGRGLSGGVAGLLLAALVGLGSGPDLRAVPVVGVDLPDVLGVTAVADAVTGAVREVVGAVLPGNGSEATAGRARDQHQPGRPVAGPDARTDRAAAGRRTGHRNDRGGDLRRSRTGRRTGARRQRTPARSTGRLGASGRKPSGRLGPCAGARSRPAAAGSCAAAVERSVGRRGWVVAGRAGRCRQAARRAGDRVDGAGTTPGRGAGGRQGSGRGPRRHGGQRGGQGCRQGGEGGEKAAQEADKAAHKAADKAADKAQQAAEKAEKAVEKAADKADRAADGPAGAADRRVSVPGRLLRRLPSGPLTRRSRSRRRPRRRRRRLPTLRTGLSTRPRRNEDRPTSRVAAGHSTASVHQAVTTAVPVGAAAPVPAP
jgi:RNA polymerase sigma-70 factor (ECF subfamily)